MPASNGWREDVVLGGRNLTVIFDRANSDAPP